MCRIVADPDTMNREASAVAAPKYYLFRLLVETVRDYAIFLLDRDGYIVSWNAGAERLKGYSSDEIVGKHFSVFYPEEDVRAGKCEHELAEAARGGRSEDEGWRVRKDGSRFWADVVITALRDDDGAVVRIRQGDEGPHRTSPRRGGADQARRGRGSGPPQGRVPGDGEPRAAHSPHGHRGLGEDAVDAPARHGEVRACRRCDPAERPRENAARGRAPRRLPHRERQDAARHGPGRCRCRDSGSHRVGPARRGGRRASPSSSVPRATSVGFEETRQGCSRSSGTCSTTR